MSIENNNTTNNVSFEFDESKFKIRSRALIGAPQIPTMIKILVKNKIVKNENQAVAVLLILSLVFVLITVFLFNNSVAVSPAVIDPTLLSQ